jgi:beta-lactamase superfamily II metal-dependent hydrolase
MKILSRREMLKKLGLATLATAYPFSMGCTKDDDDDENGNSHGGNGNNGTESLVGKVLPNWEEGYLDIHVINTGRGESTLYIFPDGTTMMVDAAGSLLSTDDPIPPTAPKPNSSITSGQVIVNYANHFIKAASNKLNYLLLTHWHPDHMGNYSTDLPLDATGAFRVNGITEVGAKIRVDKMIDREYPDYNLYTNLKSSAMKNQIANYRKFTDWAKTAYGTTVERFDVGKADQIVMKQNPSKYSGFQVRNIIANGIVWTGSGAGTINTLPANAADVEAADSDENIFSIGFHLTYGQFDYFAGGDLQYNGKSTYPWQDVEVPVISVMPVVDVMKANHHGTSNCNGEAFLKRLRPSTVLIHPWRDVQPNPETIGRMYAANADCRIFSTCMTTANATRLSAYLSKFFSTQGHIVVRVEPQGLKYSVYVLDDSNEEYKVKKVFGPYQSN